MNLMADLLEKMGNQGLTLGSIESMTSGLFAATAASIPGASKVFKGGLVTYSSSLKVSLLGIDPNLIEEKGVVSAEVAKEMAERGRKRLGVDVAISITGNAGPTTEPGQAGVGVAYMGVATKEKILVLPYQFHGERNEIRAAAVDVMAGLGLVALDQK
ncbi:MAG: CinA family protein [Bacilli bacterium]|nr:CinA family protein [Bacilli bacterium]